MATPTKQAWDTKRCGTKQLLKTQGLTVYGDDQKVLKGLTLVAALEARHPQTRFYLQKTYNKRILELTKAALVEAKTVDQQKFPQVKTKDHYTRFNLCIKKHLEEGLQQGDLVEVGQLLQFFRWNTPISWPLKLKPNMAII